MLLAIFKLLDRIQQRPEMFVGGSTEDRAEQLHNLEHVLFGYQLALADHGLGTDLDFLAAFAAYLRDEHGCSAASGPIAALFEIANNPDDAWDLFWTGQQRFRDKLKLPHDVA